MWKIQVYGFDLEDEDPTASPDPRTLIIQRSLMKEIQRCANDVTGKRPGRSEPVQKKSNPNWFGSSKRRHFDETLQNLLDKKAVIKGYCI